MLDRTADPSERRTPYGPPGAVERLAAALPGPLRDALPAEIRSKSPWPVRVDLVLDDGVTEADVESWVPVASMRHSGGDALELAVRDGRVVGVRGRAADRVNHGRFDPREPLSPPGAAGRLTCPLVRDGDRLVEATWDEAMDRVVQRSRELLARPGGWGRFGFYTGGRLFLEELYTLAVIGKAGIGTPHMDGDTRTRAAPAAIALAESFGADGQPGTYGDIDHCDAIALWGHDAARTHTVLWERVLDRRCGPRPPVMIAVDPDDTPTTRAADLHLPVRRGTNVALLNGLLHELIAGNRYDPAYVERHTIGFAELCRIVDAYPAKRVAEICAVPAGLIEQAAEVIGTAERLVSTVEQGFHRSNQATAAACQVNNLHLLRGMLGRPGAGVLQMSRLPAGRNALETGATGDLPGLRNWANPRHVRELAELWNVDPAVIPHLGAPTPASQIFRYAEEGSIGLLWISGANPVAEVPGFDRVLRAPEVFVVAQDLYLTETARLADVVLPAAGWGEKRGTLTSVDRTVHLCERAVPPPGEARPDLEIFLDYARRMDFRDRDGAPLVGWHDAESAFEAWKACSRGRPCDYTGITYERLRAGGIQWSCTPAGLYGTERLYAGGRFATDPDRCQTYGHDLATGAEYGPQAYLGMDPGGRAFLRAADYEPSPEVTGEDYPLVLRTHALGPGNPPDDPALELHPNDAAALAIQQGDAVRVEAPMGALHARARLSGSRQGVVDLLVSDGCADWATQLIAWDPVSRQVLPAAVAVRVVRLVGMAIPADQETRHPVSAFGAEPAQPVHAEPVHAESVHVEPINGEPVHAEPVTGQPVQPASPRPIETVAADAPERIGEV